MSKTLDICKKTRHIARDTFYVALKELLSKNTPFSEVGLRDRWLKKLRKHTDIFPDGWYIPPPHGMAILFGHEKNDRVSFKSLRPVPSWPKENIFFDKQGLMTFYASAVSREGMIGDFGATLYFGSNKTIQHHFKKSFQLIHAVFEQLEVGMTFAEIYALAATLMKKNNLYSDLLSPTDPTGTNIGHTIVSLEKDELQNFENGKNDWEQTKDILSKKRKFINSIEQTKIEPCMAFTLEPRPQVENDASMPMAWFHTIVLFDENGKKELLTGFDKIFALMEMEYMYE